MLVSIEASAQHITSVSAESFKRKEAIMENINLTLIMIFLILFMIKSNAHPKE